MKIMVCFDDSDPAHAAIDLAVKHALAFNAAVYILTSMIGGAENSAEEIDQAKDAMEKAKTRVEDNNIPCENHLLIRGFSPGEDLVRFAGTNKIDEIIIGIKRKSKVGKLLFGSTAQYVILEAPCPVLTVH